MLPHRWLPRAATFASAVVAISFLGIVTACTTNSCSSNDHSVTNCGSGSASGGAPPATIEPSAMAPAPTETPPGSVPTEVPVVSSGSDGFYLEEYYKQCDISPSSIQRGGPATIAGQQYDHTISQTPNGFAGTYFNLPGAEDIFDSVVGLTSEAASDETAKFEVVGIMAGGGMRHLYESPYLTFGQTRQVHVNLSGVLRLGIAATPGANNVGPQGTAGWGDAKITGGTSLHC